MIRVELCDRRPSAAQPPDLWPACYSWRDALHDGQLACVGLTLAVVVTGAAAIDGSWGALLRTVFQAYGDRLEVRYLTGLPMAELLGEGSRLSAGSFILHLTIFRDVPGRGRRVADRLRRAGRADGGLPAARPGRHGTKVR